MEERDVDILIRLVHQQMPEVNVIQLQKRRESDDDNLWWFSLPGVKSDVQLESSYCPFLLETDEQCCKNGALKATTPEEAVKLIVEYLKSARDGKPTLLSGQLYWNVDNGPA